MDKGAVTVRDDGTFVADPVKAKAAVADLTRDIMTIQAEGNYAAAKALRDTGVMRPPVQAALDKMTTVPVDIEPQFTTANQLLAEIK